MLKRLQLVGFKSFADRTDFDFPPGLTAIVGPNGSGKSNIVDSVRWVLGEQSAKSLRGSEMSDVIFNGSASRRSLGLAEVSLTFDNSRHILATDAEEVQITRRVYRSGEGEYLINQQPCRLKDIKDLFLGSGAGADAYCIIEQGRVDVLLQASTRERRVIFEEAAGISRFKAKKTETLRRLDRVDQDVLRLKDILDEVDKQLRSVRLQAAKAQRYQEHSERLKELRIALGLREYHELAQQLEAEGAVLEELRCELQQEAEQAEGWERELQALEEALARLDAAAHEREAALADARQRITAERATFDHESSLSAELEADLSQTRVQLIEATLRVGALAESARDAAADLHDAETAAAEKQSAAERLESELTATTARLSELQEQVKKDKEDHLELLRQAGQHQNEVVSYKAELDNLTRARERLLHRSDQAADTLASLERQLREMAEADQAIQDRLGRARQTLADNRQERDRLQQLLETTRNLAAELRAERSGLASRVEVLEGLERSHEGVTTGVREVFALLGQPDPGPWRTVLGLVADLFTVRREYAPLIDLALGERAQHFVVRDPVLLRAALEQRGEPFSGRVSFVPLAPPGPQSRRLDRLAGASPLVGMRTHASLAGTPAHPGVVALAEHLVICEDAQLAALPRQLLARTLIVRDLTAARAIASRASGFRCVTLQGELLEADGTLTVGMHHAETGLLSRKSELRELREQATRLDERLAGIDADLTDLTARISRADEDAATAQQEITILTDQATDLRSRLIQNRERRDGLQEEVQLSRGEIDGLEREMQSLKEALRQAREQAAAAESRVRALLARVHEAEREVGDRELQRHQFQEQCTAARVALAQVEERRSALAARARQFNADLSQRRQELQQGESRLDELQTRVRDCQDKMLSASSALAVAYLDKESAERLLADLSRQRDDERQRRHGLAEQTQGRRQSWQARQEQAHARELVLSDLRHRLTTLVERLRDDYQIDLAELYKEFSPRSTQRTQREEEEEEEREVFDEKQPPPGEQTPSGDASDSSFNSSDFSAFSAYSAVNLLDPVTVNEEIAELRRKLSRLGNVNLAALDELAELEVRACTLQAQYDDLSAAKRSLEEIIAKINVDSRRLFAETLAAVRTHFQELFRKLFGGGQADIILEDDVDILESGIEVIARPPGKELRSISLMSGGEKTLTAVALLLAIFRSKPSPFCLLDEVDAALDEANIGRLIAVLREFLDLSQFILITHSKRTMAAADVLYGVTMQESGISKRVAVRFEDWPDDDRSAAEEQVA